MKQEQQAGKRIVSKGAFTNGLLRHLGLLDMGFVGIILGGVLCGGVPVCLAYILREFHFAGLLVVGVSMLVFFSVFLGWRLIKKSEQLFEAAQYMQIGVLLTRANTADLPVPESLVRASQEPVQAQEAVLLRAATEISQTEDGEHLLRASVGGREATQEQQTGKRIVSNGAYDRLFLSKEVSGFVGIVFLGMGFLCGASALLLCLFGMNFLWAALLSIASYGLCRMGLTATKKANNIDDGVTFTHAISADLPASASLVRASQEPMQAQEAVLLRAASEIS